MINKSETDFRIIYIFWTYMVVISGASRYRYSVYPVLGYKHLYSIRRLAHIYIQLY
jgi:hypothetical protein